MIETREELDAIKASCQSMVTKSSGLSAGAAIIPIPGVDLGSDVAILTRLIPNINQKFGLTPEQIESLDTESKLFVMTAISNTGSKLAGKYITKKLIVALLQKMGVKVAAKGVTKFVPFIGSAVAGSISFTAMKMMGNRHIEDCYQIALAALENERLEQDIVLEPEPLVADNLPTKAK
ncbi:MULTISPECIES: hypothetical protein [unclassified Halomonas]|uniref:hypothetical protein n=1 Tax=unclassified Halomonas TaxID=2609666 RepID=UPI0006DBA780|nr:MULTISPECIES: hypothetical protein [unclassified Halomonas]KPQ26445.1 MAG: hypothetical protein HLUCCO06_06525 [Halomonas sp. HL-93]SBR50821.1 hypothetical protein GA0071314_2876 [Halomonas sp. HL-93]SNY97054.1 hypothetical protein SAMN04488142_1619 [Halomonas sp. hl-4]